MSRWAIIDKNSKIVVNAIIADTFEIADSSCLPSQTPVPYPYEMEMIYPGQVYNEETQQFTNPGSEDAEV